MLYFKSNDEKTPLKKKKSATDSNIDLSGIEFDISIDSKYNATSQNAQSGEAVAQAVAQSLSKLSSQVGSVLRYKGSVNSQSNLNSITSKEIGDVYDVKDTGNNYVWTSNGWDKLSEDLTNLVKENTFNTLNTQVRSHISNRDTTAKHLDAETYQKLNDTTVYSSEQLDALIEEVLQSYVDSGDLVTEKFLEESLADIETKIEESIIQNVQTEARNSFLTNQSLEVYKDEIVAKKKGYIKSEQANILDIYAKGDNRIAPALANRKDKTLYIIGDGAEIEQLDNIIYLYITTTTNNQAVNLGYNLGRWEQTGVATEIRHRGSVDWGDNSAITEFDGTEGIANSTANSLYHVYTTPNTYQIKISGVVKWSKVSTSSSNSSTPNSIREVLTRIEIPTGKKSPLYYIDTYAFYYCKNLELIPDNLFDSCTQATNFSYCFSNTQITKIPERLFDSCTQATNFSRCFQNTQITEIPQGLFDSCTQARDFSYCFYNTKITAIPQGLFDSCTQATDFSSCFFMTKITTIPQGLFDKCTQAKDFSYCFQNAKITIIPERLFDKCTQATNFSYCFGGTQITEIPQNLFAKNNAVTNFSYTFNNCSKVKGNLPTLWNTYPTVMHDQCFCGCEQATNYNDAIIAGWTCRGDSPMPDGDVMVLVIETTEDNQAVNLGYNLGRWEQIDVATDIQHGGKVDWGDGSTITKFDGTEGITDDSTNRLYHVYTTPNIYQIKISGVVKWNKVSGSESNSSTPNSIRGILKSIEIPDGHNSPLYYIDNHAFASCRKLELIPFNLFENCKTVTDFSECFYYCTSLNVIPTRLFDNCTSATSFAWCFASIKANTIPSKLFDNCIQVINFESCFNNMKNVTEIPSNLFDKCIQVTTFNKCFNNTQITKIPKDLFINNKKVIDFNLTFTGCTAVTGELPELWESHREASCYNCFCSCTKATNYDAATKAGWTCNDNMASYPSGTMILTIKTTKVNQVVNLGYNLGRWENEDDAAKKYTVKGKIKFDDNLPETEFYGNEGIETTNNPLVHTYAEIGEHKITIRGKIKWNKTARYIGTSYPDYYPTAIQTVLTQIEIPEGKKSPIFYIDTYGFYHCQLLETIKGKLFENCKEVTSFLYSLSFCSKLDNLPTGLFANCSAVTKFDFCFTDCKALQTLPEDLFVSCPNVTMFEYCFSGCTALQSIPANIFSNNHKVFSFAYAFNNCHGITGKLPELWNTHSDIQLLAYGHTFNQCVNASNYQEAVEQGWA